MSLYWGEQYCSLYRGLYYVGFHCTWDIAEIQLIEYSRRVLLKRLEARCSAMFHTGCFSFHVQHLDNKFQIFLVFTWASFQYEITPMPGEERLGSRVCLDWWNLWLPRTCPNFIAFFVFYGTAFSSILRKTGKTRVYADHLVFLGVKHYSLGRRWIRTVSWSLIMIVITR